MTTQILNFAFSITGLELTTHKDGGTTVATYDPQATCNILKEIGAIEDFTTDSNLEPVVLFADSNEPKGFGYELWCDFVKSFPFQQRTAEIIIEFQQRQIASIKFQAKIAYLLSPLQAA